MSDVTSGSSKHAHMLRASGVTSNGAPGSDATLTNSNFTDDHATAADTPSSSREARKEEAKFNFRSPW